VPSPGSRQLVVVRLEFTFSWSSLSCPPETAVRFCDFNHFVYKHRIRSKISSLSLPLILGVLGLLIGFLIVIVILVTLFVIIINGILLEPIVIVK